MPPTKAGSQLKSKPQLSFGRFPQPNSPTLCLCRLLSAKHNLQYLPTLHSSFTQRTNSVWKNIVILTEPTKRRKFRQMVVLKFLQHWCWLHDFGPGSWRRAGETALCSWELWKSTSIKEVSLWRNWSTCIQGSLVKENTVWLDIVYFAGLHPTSGWRQHSEKQCSTSHQLLLTITLHLSWPRSATSSVTMIKAASFC